MTISTSSILSDCILAMRDFLSSNISDPLSTARPSGERFVMTCVDSTTEILTIDGWKKYNEIKTNNLIYTFNKDTQKYEIKPILQLNIQNYKGKMIKFNSKNLKMLLTSNHNCLVSDRRAKTKYKFVKADNLNSNHLICVCGLEREIDVNEKYSDSFVRLIGWILAEGYVDKEVGYVVIYQSEVNKSYVEEIRNCLNNVGFEYNESFRERIHKEYEFYISNKCTVNLLNLIPNKCLNMKLFEVLSNRQLKILLETLMKGDGTKRGNNFVQKKREFMDYFQILSLFCGYRATIQKNRSSILVSHLSNFKNIGIISGTELKKEIIDYEGIIWCPYVENNTWIARKDDYIFITGNSYPRRIVSYPIITVLGNVQGDKQLGQQSEMRRVDIELQVRVWARNEKEKNTIYDEVYNDVKSNQFPFSTTGTWDNLGLQDFYLKSAIDLDEFGEEGCKSKIIKYGMFFITA